MKGLSGRRGAIDPLPAAPSVKCGDTLVVHTVRNQSYDSTSAAVGQRVHPFILPAWSSPLILHFVIQPKSSRR